MTEAGDLARADYSGPSRNCDIVMKGGITSGVVYPHAICHLARTYRFRNIGGTSAGAIAAAATAAAEYGRERRGFNELAGLPEWIGAGKNLRNLFQPQPSTRRLFAVMIAALEGGGAKACLAAVGNHFLAFLLGALPGLALLVLAILDGAGALVAPAALAGLVLAAIGGVAAILARLAYQVMRSIPDNGYGICSGGPAAKPGGPQPLTPWLTDLLNGTAGLPASEPLTFGHLWAGPGGDRSAQPAADDRFLQLAMMTTNLVNRRAHQMPWDNRGWYFDPGEFRRLFPPEVVDWMEAHPPPEPTAPAERRQSRLRRQLLRPLLPLPAAADLPVVVATRMSLSFPVLLGAVPLWRLDISTQGSVLDEWYRWGKEQGDGWDPSRLDRPHWPSNQPPAEPAAECCWFSDGGISSNFPVHFFDRLIPRWPTFAINLRPFAPGAVPDPDDQSQNTSMVDSNGDGIADWWYRFPLGADGRWWKDGRLGSFLSSAMRTMQNRVDEAQMRVPGYRDRIAHVSMDKDEGGMNLTMPPETIAALTERGRAAAELLREAYTRPDSATEPITWDNHRWVRLRSSLAVLERMHGSFADGYAGEPMAAGERSYEQLLKRDMDEFPASYPLAPASRQLAEIEVEAILRAAARQSEEASVTNGAPRPEPQGRIVPTD